MKCHHILLKAKLMLLTGPCYEQMRRKHPQTKQLSLSEASHGSIL